MHLGFSEAASTEGKRGSHDNPKRTQKEPHRSTRWIFPGYLRIRAAGRSLARAAGNGASSSNGRAIRCPFGGGNASSGGSGNRTFDPIEN
jgi:hypothetical protein